MRKSTRINESVIAKGEAHFMKAFIPIVIAVLIVIGSFSLVGEIAISEMMGVIFVDAVFIGCIVLYLKYCGLVVTDKRVFGNRGLIKTKTLSSPIDKITNVSVSQTLLGKILGYGTIYIDTISGDYTFKYIKNPMSLHNAIIEQTSK